MGNSFSNRIDYLNFQTSPFLDQKRMLKNLLFKIWKQRNYALHNEVEFDIDHAMYAIL
jgi:hypothetical protein